jgi:hypothetical protein
VKSGELAQEATKLREAAKSKDVKQTTEVLQRQGGAGGAGHLPPDGSHHGACLHHHPPRRQRSLAGSPTHIGNRS